MPEIEKLPLHVDARGWLMVGPEGGAYTYATCCLPGAVKAWHRHQEHTDRMWCVSGTARIVTAVLWGGEDAEPDDVVTMWYEVKEHIVGPLSPKMVTVPPGVWHGFEALGGEPCVIVNCPDAPYDPDDEEKAPPDAIPFGWGEAAW